MGTGAKNYIPPEWITADFLQDVLREYFKDETVQIKDLTLKGDVKGNGFASEMHRAIFNLIRNDQTTKFSVIIKGHPKGVMGAVAQKSKLFRREILAYKGILLRVEEMLRSIGDNTKLVPICYYTTETPEPFLILEDLQLSGFENVEKGRLLNLDYIMPTIEKLAKMHACSLALAKENPQIMEFFEEAPISQNPERRGFLNYFQVNIKCIAEEIAHWRGYEQITEKVYKLSENVVAKAIDMYESQVEGLRVFNVADLWLSNLMFHIDNQTKEPDDVVLIDFQLAYYGSPAVDLNYFLFGSMNENVRKVHYKFVVYEYHRILQETLQKLNYEGHIPTLKEIHMELIKNSLQGVIAATCLTPIVFMESEGADDEACLFEPSEEGDERRRANIENPKYRAFLQRTVKEFELSGFLD